MHPCDMSYEAKVRLTNLNNYCLRKGWVSRKNPERGSPVQLEKALGKTQSFWSDLMRGNKSFGADLAREIEEKLGLPKYALDGDDHSTDFVAVPVIDIEVSAGHGKIADVVEEGAVMQFRRDFLASIGISPINAAVFKVKGASMEPTIPDRCHLLVNRAATEPVNGKVFVFVKGNEIFCKRLVKKDDDWYAVSDNPDRYEYPDIDLFGSDHFRILGRGLWVAYKL